MINNGAIGLAHHCQRADDVIGLQVAEQDLADHQRLPSIRITRRVVSEVGTAPQMLGNG